MKQIFQFGLSRSGNNGLSNLIIQSFNDVKNTVHINDLQDNTLYKYEQFRNNSKTVTYVEKKWSGFKGASLCVISLKNKKHILPHMVNVINTTKYADTYGVLLLRNPFNMLASAYRFYAADITWMGPNYILHKIPQIMTNTEGIKKILILKKQWLNYITSFLTIMTDIEKKQRININIPARERVSPPPSLFIPIIYSKFYKDKAYRHSCLQKMGITCNDDHLDTIYKGGWSSFGPRTEKITNYEDLFCRYKKYSNNTWFKKNIMEDAHLKILWNKICVKFSLTNEIMK